VLQEKDLGADLFLIFSGKVDKVVIFSANKEWNGCLVEASSLSIPLFDAIKGALPSQIEHEQDGHGIIADEGQHVDKFSLTSKIPDREGDFCVADRYRLLHEVHAWATNQY
jgi:hypothetical protein